MSKKCKVPSEVPFHILPPPLIPPPRRIGMQAQAGGACKWLWISQFLRFIGVHENRDQNGMLMASVVLILYMSEIVSQPESTIPNLFRSTGEHLCLLTHQPF